MIGEHCCLPPTNDHTNGVLVRSRGIMLLVSFDLVAVTTLSICLLFSCLGTLLRRQVVVNSHPSVSLPHLMNFLLYRAHSLRGFFPTIYSVVSSAVFHPYRPIIQEYCVSFPRVMLRQCSDVCLGDWELDANHDFFLVVLNLLGP